MKKLIAIPKKKITSRHVFEPLKTNYSQAETDTTSITPISTTHF